MYTTYWQLTKRPFEIGADPFFYYSSESHQTILMKLRYVLETRRGSGLLTGEPGSGKSMILALLAELGKTGGKLGPVFESFVPFFSGEDLLLWLAKRMAPESFAPESFKEEESGPKPLRRACDVIEQFLENAADEALKPILALREPAAIRNPEVWAMLRSLTAHTRKSRPLLSVLLIAPKASAASFPEFEPFLETIAELGPLSESETAAYVTHRLGKAGAESEIFTPDALEAIHRVTLGNPRRISRIADLALLIGYAEKRENLDAEMIDTLEHEMIL